ncbi:MAG TPA: excinuclease ABC subunit B [Leptospiraceae bacterium]|nr:excinuclease ABC subunit B [Spirochaetaceae bacterium]HBS05463.1 excinuclease ABC subunit B [Leptospiraceae bacterium]|tara:strand:- start:191141 stop:193339 length:2199 start_codon:yes stop_codon:yes gene_type:complete
MSENRKFRLVSDYKPAGDQPRAIQELTEAAQAGDDQLCLVGVTGSGKTYTMAGFVENVQKPTLVLTHNKTLAAQLYKEFREFFPENAVEYFVSYYDYYQPEAYVPSSDTYIEKDASINDEIDRLRLRATSSLLERSDVIIVSSVSCIYGLGSPEEYRHSLVMLDRGLTIERNDVIRQLLHIQYQRNDLDFSRGNFRVRGDTVEVFPAYRNEGIRIEWFGDEIDNLSYFDPLTGKILDSLERAVIYPAKHFITSPPRLKEALEKIDQELQLQVQRFQKEGKPLEAERIQQRTRYDMEMLRELGYCNGIENYSRHLTGREAGEPPACLLDYFPEDFWVIIDESHVTLPQVRGMYEGDRSRKQTLVDFGFRLPSALDNRPLNFPEFERIANKIMYVSATPADYEISRSQKRVEQLIRPTGLLDPTIDVRPVKGQIEDLVQEIKKRVEKDQRTLVTTLTKKMAEDLSDYLREIGIDVAYLHSEIHTIERVEIIRDLRKGKYQVLVGVNLLREGLDMPEVSLVAILDADREGFLRNTRSLIQTMGRAARNVEGQAILYADKITPSMREAMDETLRRRAIQEEHNKKMGITPTTIRKQIQDIIERSQEEDTTEDEVLTRLKETVVLDPQMSKRDKIAHLKEEMLSAARNMEFEKAAMIRDAMQLLESGAALETFETRILPFSTAGQSRSSGRGSGNASKKSAKKNSKGSKPSEKSGSKKSAAKKAAGKKKAGGKSGES